MPAAALVLLVLQTAPDAGAAPAPAAQTAPAAAPKPKKKFKPKGAPLVLFHINRHETLTLPRDASGHFPDGTYARFKRFMRCHHTGRQHAMAPRLLRLLSQVSRHFGNKRILVVAGYRAPQAARNPKSPHKQGLAADFRVDGVPNQEVRDYCRTLEKVGVGYYPNSSFVHLDVRKRSSAFWIDYSGPGDAPLYSRAPEEDLKTGRADTFKPGQVGEGEGDSEPEEGGALDSFAGRGGGIHPPVRSSSGEGQGPLPSATQGGGSPQTTGGPKP